MPLKINIDIDNAVQSLSPLIQTAALDSSKASLTTQNSKNQLPHHLYYNC